MPEMNAGIRTRIGWGLVIHGGVGVLSPKELTPELERAYLDTLLASLSAHISSAQLGTARVGSDGLGPGDLD